MINCDCPRCGSRSTKAFRVMHQDGTRDFHYGRTGAFYFRGSIGLHGSTTRGRSQTLTAQLAGPPIAPMTRFLQGRGVPVVLVISAFVGGATGFFVGLAALIALAVIFGRHDSIPYGQKAREWSATFRCNRCGTVFAVVENDEQQPAN